MSHPVIYFLRSPSQVELHGWARQHAPPSVGPRRRLVIGPPDVYPCIYLSCSWPFWFILTHPIWIILGLSVSILVA